MVYLKKIFIQLRKLKIYSSVKLVMTKEMNMIVN